MTNVNLEMPPKLIPVFTDDVRYRGAYGGRGSAKTRTFAKMSAVRGYMLAESGKSGVILCCREFMNSLSDSSLEEIKQAIRSEPWLESYYEIGEKYVKTKCGRVKYVFTGLHANLDSIKSKARVLLCWIDEAEAVSEAAYIKLLPTVREEDSEVWLTWNPEIEDSPTDKRFRQNPPASSNIVELNYVDNPWFPDVLEQERLNDQARLDPNTYSHIWDGAYLNNSDKQVLSGKWRIADFEPQKDWDGPYFGMDFGFALDPTTLVKCWISGNTLYVEKEAGKVKLELDSTASYFTNRIPESRYYVIRADSARPESISYLHRNGLPKIEAVKKWPGSVEDGIQFLRSFDEIVINSNCRETKKECQLYSYKVDKRTGDVMPTIVDLYNHYIDALRYALTPMIKRRQAPITKIKMRA